MDNDIVRKRMKQTIPTLSSSLDTRKNSSSDNVQRYLIQKRFGFSLILLLLWWGVPGFSHPHTFIDCELTVILDDQGFAGFHQRWVFGEMFTAFLLEDFDTDRDRQFDATEIHGIKQGAFDNLREYEYFTHILIDGEKFPVQQVTSFSVEMTEDGKAVYRFFIPCPVKQDAQARDILIAIFDDTYYTDVTLVEESITFQNPCKFQIEQHVHEIPELTYYYNQIIPKGLWISLKPQGASEQPSLLSADDTTVGTSRSRYPRLLQALLTIISSWQKALKHHLTRLGQEIREQPYGMSFWLFLLFSSLYGGIHALGPGHGKTIVVSYFLSHPGQYMHGVLMGHLLTFIHVFSAVSIVLILRLAFNHVGGISFETAGKNLETVSYSLLIFLGLFLFGKCMYELIRGNLASSDEVTGSVELKPLLLTAFATGLVPCPGAALILIFTITQQILFAGLMAMVCMAVGMGATTSVFALVAIASRHTLFRLTARRQKLFMLSHTVLSIGGALVIIAIGTLLLLR